MANRAVQAMRDGLLTLSAWDLDDALFTLDDDGIDLKRWGMWDSVGSSYSGDASLEELRPWFSSWAILGTNFPNGTEILATDAHSDSGIYASAGRTPDGSYSVAIVSTTASAKSVNVLIDGGPRVSRLQHYAYFSNDRRTDSQGYPVPKPARDGVNSETGVNVTLPGPGLVVLSFAGVGATGDARR